MKNKKILVVGAAGFIGCHLTEILLKNDCVVDVLLNKDDNNTRLDGLVAPSSRYFDDSVWENDPYHCVINLATLYIKNETNAVEKEKMLATNLLSCSKILWNTQKNGCKNFVNASTCFVYKFTGDVITEDSPVLPYNFYAANKLTFEEILKYESRKNNLNVINLRLFPVYGEKDNDKLFNLLVKTAIEDKPLDFNEGNQEWNYTYVKDTANAFYKASMVIDNLLGYETINVGSSTAISIKDIGNEIEKLNKRKLKIKWGAKPYNENEIFKMVCSNKKAKKLLGWKEETPIKQGIYNVYNYIRSSYGK